MFLLQLKFFLPISSWLFDVAMLDAIDEELVFSKNTEIDVDLLVVVVVLGVDNDDVDCTVDNNVEDIRDSVEVDVMIEVEDDDVNVDDSVDDAVDNDVNVDNCVDDVVDVVDTVDISAAAIFSSLSSTIDVISKSIQLLMSALPSSSPSSLSPICKISVSIAV